MKQADAGGRGGKEDVRPAVVVVVRPDGAQRARAGEAGRLGPVLEGPVAGVVEEHVRRRVVGDEHVEAPVAIIVHPADAARAPARIRGASGAGDVDEAAAQVPIESVRLRAAAALRAEADVQVGPAVTVEVAPAGSVLIAAWLETRRGDDILEAAVAEVPVERGARVVVAHIDIDAPVAVEVGERGVV